MCVGIKGRQGRGAGGERGSRKSDQTQCQIGVTAMTTQSPGVLITMVPSKTAWGGPHDEISMVLALWSLWTLTNKEINKYKYLR
jgi:hypothetical protein